MDRIIDGQKDDPSHVINATTIELREDLSYKEAPVRIFAREENKLRNRTISYMKVLWENHEEIEATRGLESKM